MATVIRFARHGTKKRPFYKIVVQDKTSPRDGRFIENIGTYDPISKGEKTLTVKRERLEYWLGTGALMSLTVGNRLKPKQKEWLSTGATTVAAPVTAKVAKAEKAPKAAPKAKTTKSKEA